MPEVVLECGESGALGIGHILAQAGLVASTSEAFRMVKQGAVRIDGERVADRGLEVPAGGTHVCPGGQAKVRPGDPELNRKNIAKKLLEGVDHLNGASIILRLPALVCGHFSL